MNFRSFASISEGLQVYPLWIGFLNLSIVGTLLYILNQLQYHRNIIS